MRNLSENKVEFKDGIINSQNKEQKQSELLELNDSTHNLKIQPYVTLAKREIPDLEINNHPQEGEEVNISKQENTETPQISQASPTPAPRKISHNFEVLQNQAQERTSIRKSGINVDGRTIQDELSENQKNFKAEDQIVTSNHPTPAPRKAILAVPGTTITNGDDEIMAQSYMPTPAPRKSSVAANRKIFEDSSLSEKPPVPIPSSRKLSSTSARQGPKILPRKHIYRFLIPLNMLLYLGSASIQFHDHEY